MVETDKLRLSELIDIGADELLNGHSTKTSFEFTAVLIYVHLNIS